MSDRQLKGIGVSPGIGVGAAIVVRWTMPEVPHRVVPRTQIEKEVRRLRAAVKDVKRYLQDMRAKAEDRAGVDEARIFDAQILMLEDKEFLAGVADLIRENHLAAENVSQALVSQANSKNWKFSCQPLNQFNRNPCFLRRARPRRNHDSLRFASSDFFNGNFVVAMHFHFATQLSQILGQVVGKRIVVVEQQNHCFTFTSL